MGNHEFRYTGHEGYVRNMGEALDKHANIEGLFAIDAREKIGRAKMAPADRFGADYDAIIAEMRQQIEAVVAGGEEE